MDTAAVPTRRQLLTAAGSTLMGSAVLLAVGAEPAAASTVPAIDISAAPYNATGDGTTDDSAAIQRAIDAGALMAARFVVYFPIPDVAYALGSALVLPSGCSLAGERGSRSRLLALSANTGPVIAASTSATGWIGLHNLEIDGNAAARRGVTSPLVALTATSNDLRSITIADCWLHAAPATAIRLAKIVDGEITRTELSEHVGGSISATGVADLRVTSSLLHDNGGAGVVIEGGTRVLIAENILRRHRLGQGIAVRGVTRADIVGNIVQSSGETGIQVANLGPSPATDVVVSDNTVVEVGATSPGASATGIDIVAGSRGAGNLARVNVARNMLASATGAGIRARSLSASGSITDLTVGTNHVSCAGSPAGTTAITVTGASIIDPVIASNLVVGAPGGGIVLGDAPASVVRPTVQGNRIRDCGGIALRVVGASSPMIFGNRAVTTGSAVQTYGLSLEGVTGVVNQFGNDFSTSTVADVSSTGGSPPTARLGLGVAAVYAGTGDPNRSLSSAPVGSIFLRTDGANGTTLYVRETGLPLTGWVSK